MSQSANRIDYGLRAHRRRALLAWMWTGLTALALVAWAIVDPPQDDLILSLTFISAALLFTALGSLIAVRQPGNRIAWLFWALGVGLISTGLMSGAIDSVPPSSPTPFEYAAFALSNSSWLYTAMLYPLLLLLFIFPTGRSLSRGWMWGGWVGWVMIPTTLFAGFFGETLTIRFSDVANWSIPNPIGFVPDEITELSGTIWGIALFAMAVGGIFGMVVRYRRSTLVVRMQVKWVLYPLLLLAMFLGATLSGGFQFFPESVFPVLFVGSIALIPVSVAVAVTRYRLFEIERIISRTLGYTVVVALLGGLFLGLVTLVTSLLPAQSSLAVAGATLAVAALFNPLRKRIQHAVDRHFNRSGYQAEALSEQFNGKLRESLTTDELIDVWSETVNEALQPAATAIWIRDT